jgi:hypothetical protein
MGRTFARWISIELDSGVTNAIAVREEVLRPAQHRRVATEIRAGEMGRQGHEPTRDRPDMQIVHVRHTRQLAKRGANVIDVDVTRGRPVSGGALESTR